MPNPLQEVFDRVATHLIEQGERAELNGGCRYRAGRLKCAFGVLIPDELYEPRMENKRASAVLNKWPELWEHLPGSTDDQSKLRLLIGDLQDAHDNFTEDLWVEQFEWVAETIRADVVRKQVEGA